MNMNRMRDESEGRGTLQKRNKKKEREEEALDKRGRIKINVSKEVSRKGKLVW